MSVSPTLRHQAVLTFLASLLDRHARADALGSVFVGPVDIALSPADTSRSMVVQPDLVFVTHAQRALLTPTGIDGAPDLVVEVVARETEDRDHVKRRDLYARGGVEEYWIVDPDAESIDVLRRHGSTLDTEAVLTAGHGEVLESALLPGLRIELTSLFDG